jgi:DNA-binding FadR family transcriptional regulator
MPIQPIDSDRLYRRIARQLSELISNGEFNPGQRLPPERELAQQLVVSRPSVREALIALEVEGWVEIRVGSGVFVKPLRPLPLASPEAGEGPFELLRARAIVEGETAALAAKQATAEEIAEIRAAVDELQRSHSSGQRSESADRRFHVAVAKGAHNGPLVAVVQLLWDQGRGAIWRQMEKHFSTSALRAATIRDHRAVLEAIAARQPQKARQAMYQHLARVDREFNRGWLHWKRRPQQGRAGQKTQWRR